MQIHFAQSRSDPVNLKAHATACLTERRICTVSKRNWASCPRGIEQFMGGTGDCCPKLHNFSAELQCWARLRNFPMEDSLIVLHNFLAQQAVE